MEFVRESLKTIEAQLEKWEQDIHRLEGKLDEFAEDARLQYRRQLDQLRAEQAELRRKIGEWKSSGKEAWPELKVGLNTAWEDFRVSLDRAMEKFM